MTGDEGNAARLFRRFAMLSSADGAVGFEADRTAPDSRKKPRLVR